MVKAARSPSQLADWYRRNRDRSRSLFDLLDPAVYGTRPIALRNPIAFYEGHLPAFSVIAFLKRGLGQAGINDRFETVFARGIDPESEATAVPRSGAHTKWPPRSDVLEYGRAVDAAVLDALTGSIRADPFQAPEQEAIFTALEHEAMHQETLLYMWRRVPLEHKSKPADLFYETNVAPPRYGAVELPAGRATLGARRGSIPFGWDNEFEECVVEVPAFDIDVHSVTNDDFRAFVADNGYDRRELWTGVGWEWRQRENLRGPAFWVERDSHWFWRGMFDEIPLPPAWPVYVSQAEAAAYARWKGRRLPTEPEYHRAAFGTPEGEERMLPWVVPDSCGDDAGVGNFDFAQWEPVPAGSRPAGASAWGVHDLVGNGWEWTSSLFEPFSGFTPMPTYPEYSVEFFDSQHYVLKGASPATAKELIRRSLRNWFRPTYPYVYAKFRTAHSL